MPTLIHEFSRYWAIDWFNNLSFCRCVCSVVSIQVTMRLISHVCFTLI